MYLLGNEVTRVVRKFCEVLASQKFTCDSVSFYFTINTKKSRCDCETLQYAPSGNKVQKAIFSFKVKVKVTRSLTLVSFERASLVEYACQI